MEAGPQLSMCEAVGTGELERVCQLIAGLSSAALNSPCDHGTTPLIHSIRDLHPVPTQTAIIAALIDASVDVNAADGSGKTALQWCARFDNAAAARQLITAGAQVNAREPDAWSPLMTSASFGGTGVLRELLACGRVDVDWQAEDHHTALTLAVERCQLQAVRILLEAGADVNAQSPTGFCALSAAVQGAIDGNATILRMLLREWHASPTGAKNRGWAVAEWAAKHGRIEAVQLLAEAGAHISAACLSFIGDNPVRRRIMSIAAWAKRRQLVAMRENLMMGW